MQGHYVIHYDSMSSVLSSKGKRASLTDRRNELSRQLILDAAIGMLERASVRELSVRGVAREANISERTVFRYFPTRDDLLDAVADAVRIRLDLPPPPTTLDGLFAAPRQLYARFEETSNLTRAALHSELFHRMRETQARARWKAVQELVARIAPRRSVNERRIAAANIRYYLAASTWYYFRFYFGFALEETIQCAETAIHLTVEGLARPKRST